MERKPCQRITYKSRRFPYHLYTHREREREQGRSQHIRMSESEELCACTTQIQTEIIWDFVISHARHIFANNVLM